MKKILALLTFTILFVSVSYAKGIAADTSKKDTTIIAADGSSYDKAVFVDANDEGTGVDDEYAWLGIQYPGYKTLGQSLMYHKIKGNDHPYDVIHIKTKQGEKKDVYFDIIQYFGKF